LSRRPSARSAAAGVFRGAGHRMIRRIVVTVAHEGQYLAQCGQARVLYRRGA